MSQAPTQKSLQTVSLTVDETSRGQKVRQTLPPKPHAPVPDLASRPRSQSQTQRPQIILPPPIPETDEEEAEVKMEQGGSARTSFTKKPPSRSNSIAGVRAKIIEVKGYDNGGFQVTNGGANPSFQRGYIDSNRSSTLGSVQSLQVQREQYCCFSRWSPFEKRLATSVGILAAVIVGLVTAVGLMAGGDEKLDEKFVWKP